MASARNRRRPASERRDPIGFLRARADGDDADAGSALIGAQLTREGQARRSRQDQLQHGQVRPGAAHQGFGLPNIRCAHATR